MPTGPRSLPAVAAVAAAAALVACTPAHAPAVRKAGKVMALGGVAGIVGSVLATAASDAAYDALIAFEAVSAIGIVTYAYAELTWPRVRYIPEPLDVRHRRWAKILTERAFGAAREGRCPRVRRLEARIRVYDREVHDFVLLRDPEVLRCLTGEPAAPGAAAPPESPALPGGEAPADGAPSPDDAPAEGAPPPEAAPPDRAPAPDAAPAEPAPAPLLPAPLRHPRG